MNGLTYYVIDLETTGLRCGYHEVTEIGIVRASDKMQMCHNIRCEYPERASWDALQVTGKTLSDLETGISKESAIEKINNFFAEDGLTPNARCIVGHNIIKFDQRFLHNMWESVGQEFPAHLFLDTIQLTKKFLDIYSVAEEKIIKTATGKTSTRLEAACKMTDVKMVKGAHSAKGDSRNTYLLWKKLVNEYNIDYIPYLKSMPHFVKTNIEEDADLLELLDK